MHGGVHIPEPQFLGPDGDAVFTVYHPTPTPSDVAVLLIPPFAEEANRSRHVLSAIARRLADNGVPSLILDPFGTGDSDGEFEDATWRRWLDDIGQAIDHLKTTGAEQFILLGVRTGASLALDYLSCTPSAPCLRVLAVSPVLDGQRFLHQLRRANLAAGISGSDPEGDNLRDGLPGYTLSPDLLAALSDLTAERLRPTGSMDIVLLEAGLRTIVPKALATIAKDWQTAGHRVHPEAIASPLFWALEEPADCAALVERAVTLITEELSDRELGANTQ